MGRIIITGDTHGSQERLCDIIAQAHPCGEDKLIVLGDFGFVWHGESFLPEKLRLDELSETFPCEILFVDGNHENFEALGAYPVTERFGGEVHEIRDRIYHLQRGSIYNIDGRSFFVFGGAYSVDKAFRKEGISWWKGELPTDAEYKQGARTLKNADFRVDFILTHTAPREIIRMLGYPPEPHDAELTGYLEWILHETEYKKWFFGHFHEDKAVTDRTFAVFEAFHIV